MFKVSRLHEPGGGNTSGSLMVRLQVCRAFYLSVKSYFKEKQRLSSNSVSLIAVELNSCRPLGCKLEQRVSVKNVTFIHLNQWSSTFFRPTSTWCLREQLGQDCASFYHLEIL